MPSRIAINGLGRIGRAALKLAVEQPELELVAVNEIGSLDNMVYLLKYDTVYGRYERQVEAVDGKLVIDGKPLVEILDRHFGVEKALLTTVHAYTATQALVDSPGGAKDLRRGRAAAQNFVPSSTGAATATAKALPAMQGRFDGVSVRGPGVVGSISDVVFVVARDTTAEEVNDVLCQKDPHASIVQLDLTRVVGGNLVKVMSWYDNEWGFTSQMIQVAVQQLGLDTPARV